MHEPREQVLPGPVLLELFKIPLLKHKHLVTKVVHCSGYARYLSGTGMCSDGSVRFTLFTLDAADSEHITLSLRGSEKATSEAEEETRPELEWWTQGCEAGYLHTGVSQKGELCYAPVFSLKQKYPLIRSLLRDNVTPDPKPEDL